MHEEKDIEIIPGQVWILWDSYVNAKEWKPDEDADLGWMSLFWDWEIMQDTRCVKGRMFFLRGWHKHEHFGRQMRVIARGKYINESW